MFILSLFNFEEIHLQGCHVCRKCLEFNLSLEMPQNSGKSLEIAYLSGKSLEIEKKFLNFFQKIDFFSFHKQPLPIVMISDLEVGHFLRVQP